MVEAVFSGSQSWFGHLEVHGGVVPVAAGSSARAERRLHHGRAVVLRADHLTKHEKAFFETPLEWSDPLYTYLLRFS